MVNGARISMAAGKEGEVAGFWMQFEVEPRGFAFGWHVGCE